MMNTLLGIGASLLAPKMISLVQDQKVNVVHALPGRVRLQCDKWKNEQTAHNLMAVFQRIPIISNVQSSAISGSLLLEFQVEKLTQEQFDGIVSQAVQTSIATYPELQSDLMIILQNIIDTINSSMKKQSGGKVDVDSLISLLLIINGILKLPTNPAFSSSLLYWAYTIITNKKNERK
ncbi:MAG: HMA2 domain-containing protein [Bacillus sp. (in: firmicutes)]